MPGRSFSPHPCVFSFLLYSSMGRHSTWEAGQRLGRRRNAYYTTKPGRACIVSLPKNRKMHGKEDMGGALHWEEDSGRTPRRGGDLYHACLSAFKSLLGIHYHGGGGVQVGNCHYYRCILPTTPRDIFCYMCCYWALWPLTFSILWAACSRQWWFCPFIYLSLLHFLHSLLEQEDSCRASLPEGPSVCLGPSERKGIMGRCLHRPGTRKRKARQAVGWMRWGPSPTRPLMEDFS